MARILSLEHHNACLVQCIRFNVTTVPLLPAGSSSSPFCCRSFPPSPLTRFVCVTRNLLFVSRVYQRSIHTAAYSIHAKYERGARVLTSALLTGRLRGTSLVSSLCAACNAFLRSTAGIYARSVNLGSFDLCLVRPALVSIVLPLDRVRERGKWSNGGLFH